MKKYLVILLVVPMFAACTSVPSQAVDYSEVNKVTSESQATVKFYPLNGMPYYSNSTVLSK